MPDFKAVVARGGGLKVSTIKRRNILLVGLTGSGKSSLINALCDNTAAVGSSMKPVTQNLKAYANFEVKAENKEPYSVTVVDTVGLGDGTHTLEEIMNEILEACQSSLSQIHRVVFAFKMDRLRARLGRELDTLYRFLVALGASKEHFVIALTFCDFASRKSIEDYKLSMRRQDDLSIFKDLPIVDVAFPQPNRCDPAEVIQRFVANKRRESLSKIFDSVINAHHATLKPFNPIVQLSSMPRADLAVMARIVSSNKPSFLSRFMSTAPSKSSTLKAIVKLRRLPGLKDLGFSDSELADPPSADEGM